MSLKRDVLPREVGNLAWKGYCTANRRLFPGPVLSHAYFTQANLARAPLQPAHRHCSSSA